MTIPRRKTFAFVRLCAAALGLVVCCAPAARAATLTWGTSGAGGSGTWNTTLTNWWTGAAQTTWNNAAPDDAVLAGTAGTLTLSQNITSGTIRATVTGYTISATSSSTLTVSTIDISSLGQSGQLTVNAQLTGSQPLTLASAGNTSASGGGDGTLGIYLTNTSNNFTGDVTISSGLVTYANNSVFGNAANKIILTGGGLLDNNTNVALSRAIEIRSGTSTFRTYGTTNVSWSSTVTGSAVVNRTDSGTLNFTGDWSGFTGTYVNQGGTTRFQNAANVISGTLAATGGTLTVENTGSNTIGAVRLSSATLLVRSNSNAFGTATISATNSTIGSQTSSTAFTLPNAINVNGTLTLDASNGAFAISGPITGAGTTVRTTGATTNAVTLSGTVDIGAGTLQVNGNNTLTIGAGAVVTATNVQMFDGTTTNSVLQIDGGSITTRYLNVGSNGSRRGTVNQTSGTLTVLSGGFGFRLGHWNNDANPANQYNLTGGLLDASAITVNIGWDGAATMTVGGGSGLANLKAGTIQLDANGDSASYNDTLTVSSRGLVEVGTGGILSPAAGDSVILNSGTVRALGAGTWGSVITANVATLSTLDSATFAVTLSNNLTGSGTINLAGSGGFTFNGTSQTVSPALTGTAPITKGNGGTTNLTGTLSTTGNVTLSNGTLQLSGTGSMLGSVDVNPSGTLLVATGANVTTGTINRGNGAGGTITIQGGATLTSGSFNNPWQASGLTINGTWNVTGGMSISIAATTTVGGTGTINTERFRIGNSTTANLSVARLNIGSSGIVNDGNTINLDGSTIGASADWSTSSGLVLFQTTTFNTLDSANGTTPRTITLNGVLSGSAGMGIVAAGSGTLALAAANTYSGTTGVAGGVLSVTNTLRNTAAVTVTGGTASLNATNIFVAGHGSAVADSMVLTATGAGSTILIAGGESRIGNVTLGSGGTLTSNRALSGFDWLMANVSSGTWATLAVTGNAAATMNGSGGLRLQNVQNFNVADVTGNPNTDLTVSLILGDPGSSGGTGGLNKSGAGTMAISTRAEYTGGTVIQAGVLDLTGGGGVAGTIRGTATVNAGATLRLSTVDATGYGTGSDRLSTINLVGGTMNVNTTSNQTLGNATINMTGGFITGTAGSNIDFFQGSSTLNTLASSTTSVISGVALSPLRQGSTTFTVAAGSTPSGVDLEIQSNMQTTPSGGGDPVGAQVIKAGAGTLRITGSVTYTGTTAVQSGTLQVGGNGTTGSISAATSVSAGALLAFNRSDAYTYSSSISGAGNVSQIGSGTLTLSGSNAYTGTTTLAAGMLALGNADAIGTTGTVSFTGGTLQFGSSNTVDYSTRIKGSSAAVLLDTNGQNVTFAGAVDSTNAAGLTKLGSGTLTLTAANTYTGNTTISAGVLRLGSGGSSGSVAGNIVNNATLRVDRTDAFTLSNLISGSGGLVQAGSGTTTLSGVNTYSGPTTINAGVLAVSTDLNLGAAPGSATPGSIVIDGGSLAFTSGFTLSSNRGIALGPTVGSGSGTIDVASGQTLIYGGVLANNGGTGGLVKAGAGTLQLSGAATYSGDTSVNAGTLQIGAGASLASSLVNVASGATLSGRGTVNATTIADGGILWPGLAGSGTLTTGSLTFSGSATVTMGVSGVLPTNRLNVVGDVTTFGTGTSVVFAFGSNLSLINTGTYSLLTYSGTLSDASAFGYTGTKGGRQSVAVSGTTVSNAVSLIIGNSFPLWTGTNGNDWFASDNWKLNTDNTPTNFQNNDTVDFNDGATLASGTVVISGSSATPASVTFSANTKPYTLEATGGFGISTGAVVKSGSALVTITNANTYDGGTTLSLGRLRVGDDGALGTGVVNVTAPAALSSDGSTAHTLANSLHLDADVTLGDATDNGNLTFTGTVTFDGASRTITTPSTVTLSGLVTNGGLTKSGSGVLAITGSNNYANGTTLSAGTLRVGNDSALGAGAIALNGGALSSNDTNARTLVNAFTIGGDVTLGDATNTGVLTLGAGGISLGNGTRQVTTASDVTFAGAVTSGGLTKTGTGTLTLSAANSHAAGTTLSAGDISLGNVGALGTGTATYAGAGTIRNTVGGTIANAVAVNAGVSGTFDSAANTTTLSGGVANAGTFTLTTTATQTLSGAVSGTGTIVKAGAGGLTLSGANTLSGAVSLTAGRLNLNSASALGTGSLLIAGSSTLDNTSGGAVTLTGPNVQSWNADFTFAGSNPLNLGTGTVTLGANRQVTVTSSTLTVGGGIGGGFALTKAGAGTLSLTGASNYSGGTTLSAGTLLVGNATALGSGTVALNAGTLNVNGVTAGNAVVLGGGTVAGTGGTLSGVISGGLVLTVTGTGSLTLSGSNTYSAGTELLGGTLNVAALSGIGSGYLAVKTGATFAYTGSGSETTTQVLWLDNGASTINVSNATGSLTWNPSGGTRSAAFTKSGPGTLTMGGAFTSGASVTVSDGVLVLTAANSHTGGTTITGGTLQIGAGGTAGSIAGNVAVNSAGSLLFNRSDALSYSGVISGSGSIRQVGTGTTTLGGSNTFTGVLTIAQGAMAVSTANNVSTNGPLGNSASAVVLGSNGFRGTLAYTGATASSSKPFTLATGGTGAFDVGSNVKLTASGLIDGSGALVKVGSGTLTVTTIGTYTGATVVDAGVFELATASYNRGLATSGVTINAGATFLANGMNILYVGSSYIPFTVNSGTLLIGGNTSGNHSHLGPLTLNGGVLTANNPAPYANQYSTLDATITVGGTARSVISGADPAYGYSLVNTGRIFNVGATGDPSGVDLLVSAPFIADGTTGLVKSGAGVMSMTGSNTYTGNTTINAGTLKVSGGQLYQNAYNGTAVVTVNTGGTLELDSFAYGAAGSLGQLADYGARRILAGGTISIVGSSQSSGNDFQVANGSTGRFNMATAGQTLTLTGNSNDNTQIGGALTFGGAGNIVVNDVISNLGAATGSIVKADAGTLTFGAAMTYTGSTTINSGTFILTGGGQLGGGSYAGAFTNNSAFVSSATANQTFSGVVSGGGSFTKSGAGTLTLSNASNSFTGGVSLSGGVLSFVSGGLGSSGTVTLGGGTLRWATGNTQDVSSRLALVSGSTATLDTNGNAVTLATGLGAGTSAALTKAGAGSLALSAAAGYSGATTISGGTLALTGGGNLASSSGVNLSASGATLDISGASGSRTISAFEGVAGAAVLLGGNTLTADNATNKSFGGVISGSGGFTKAGAGILTFSDIQIFTGAARVDAGTLAIGGTNSLAAASQIFVAEGAALDATAAGLNIRSGQLLGGYGLVDGNATSLSFASGATLSPGGSVGSLDGDFTNATLTGGMTYVFEVNMANGTAGGPNGWDLFTNTGAITLDASVLNPINLTIASLDGSISGTAAGFDPNNNYAWKFLVAGSGNPITYQQGWFTVTDNFQNSHPGTFYVARGDQMSAINASGSSNELYVVYAAIPEPGTLALAGIGLAAVGLAAARRRKRRPHSAG